MIGEGLVGSCWDIYLRGDDGRRVRGKSADCCNPRTGELLRSASTFGSKGDGKPLSLIPPRPLCANPGNTSSAGFLGVRTRAGDPSGLEGRRCCVFISRCPVELTPGIDCALDIGGAKVLAEDFDRLCV